MPVATADSADAICQRWSTWSTWRRPVSTVAWWPTLSTRWEICTTSMKHLSWPSRPMSGAWLSSRRWEEPGANWAACSRASANRMRPVEPSVGRSGAIRGIGMHELIGHGWRTRRARSISTARESRAGKPVSSSRRNALKKPWTGWTGADPCALGSCASGRWEHWNRTTVPFRSGVSSHGAVGPSASTMETGSSSPRASTRTQGSGKRSTLSRIAWSQESSSCQSLSREPWPARAPQVLRSLPGAPLWRSARSSSTR